MITNYLKEFNDILIPYHNHMVVGGIWALRLHGLRVRDTADLDMIVYNPTDSLLEKLANEVLDETDSSVFDPPGSRRRSYKLTRNGYTMDFLIEFEGDMPGNLLAIPYSDRLWPVQRINLVIDAKKKYGREKDLKDFLDFKRDNF